ncbi:MAG: hypothetical protein KAS62_04520, partial [Candidatus Delongbacteria bacterium]|nr:hypothetical protein [Candidatus Delongbacteria bacterium]
MKLKIGISNLQPGWEIILQQEGLNFEEISLDDPVNVDDYSVLIINKSISNLHHLNFYLENGGSAIINSKIYASINNIKLHSKKVKFSVSDKESIFADLGLIDFYTRFHWLKSEEIQYLDSNLKIQYQKIGIGILLILPFDVNSLILDTEFIRKKVWIDRPELPSEIVTKVSKGKIRQIIEHCLQFLHDEREIPLVQSWRFPRDGHSLFMFRIDRDFCSTEQATALYELCKKHKIKGTWFVDTISRGTIQHVYCKVPDQEIALH